MSGRAIEFPPKDEPLREDVHILGQLVGAVLREQGPESLFDDVERVRLAAIARREGERVGLEDVEAVVRGLAPDAAELLVRAFSTYFQVVNRAEEIHRIRRGRTYLRPGAEPQEGSLAATFRELAAIGVDAEEASGLLANARLEPVFTAHPTESTRPIILEKQLRIAQRLLDRLNPDRTPREERVALERIRSEITSAWQTEEHPGERPTVADEREQVLFYVTNVLYPVVPSLYEVLEETYGETYPGGRLSESVLLRVGSWVGGDMDGNPNVDASTIRATLARHRSLILDRYIPEVEALSRHLTQSASRVGWSDEIDRRTERYASMLPEAMERVPRRSRGMGYRVLLHLMAERLEATRRDRAEGYRGPGELADDLRAIEASLEAHRGHHAGVFGVKRLRRRLDVFGFHLASLDVRQDARELRDVLAELLDDPGWTDRGIEERAAVLRDALEGRTRLPDPSAAGEGAKRALDVFRAIGEGRARYGPDALGPFVISMAHGVDDVLAVLLLARMAGLSDADGTVPLDVAPLLETVSDLEHAGSTLRAMYSDGFYGPHLTQRGGRQTVMVGYSDSNKDGGIASARWSLQKAQRIMAEVSQGAGVRLTVFHGRGGTVSRGGGAVHRAVAATPEGALSGRLRLTEQGEVIDAKYGLQSIALRNLERMLGAVVLKGAEAKHAPRREDRAWDAAASTMAEVGRATYRALVYDDPRFFTFFRFATPIDVIERMAIGSRPASRRAQRGIQDLRAIPWVFAWTQTRATLPAWYGLGSGLEAAVARHGRDVLVEAIQEWAFLGALIDDVEMVLAKTDLEIAERYVLLAPPGTWGVFDVLRSEFERTVSMILDLKGQTEVLERDATLQRSIRLRNPYVDPMNLLQVDLLARWRATGGEDDALLGALVSSVQGIARGLKNTG